VTLGSLIRLGWHFVKRLMERLFDRRPGLARFEEYYAEDRLRSLSAEESEALASFSRCTACGMCDATFSAYDRASRSELRGPSDLPLAYTRNLPDLDAARTFVAHLEKGDLEALEAVCPARIPFRRLVRFVKDKSVVAPPAASTSAGATIGALAARTPGPTTGPDASPPARPKRHDPG
jgi:succinate dehydrogenase/fumarate reductase-like Fe-S protein